MRIEEVSLGDGGRSKESGKTAYLSLGWLYLSRFLSVFGVFYLILAIFFPSFEDRILSGDDSIGWIATYRILIIFGLMSILWLFAGTKIFARIVIYAGLYPVILGAKIICFNWQFFLSSAPLIYGFFQSIKCIVIVSVAFSIGCALAVGGDESWKILTGVGLLVIALGVFLYKQFSAALASKTFFGRAAEGIEKFWSRFQNSSIFRLPEDYDLVTSEGAGKASAPIMFSYLLFSLFNRFTRSAKNLVNGRKLECFCLLSWFGSFIVTVFSFSFIFYGLKRNDHLDFQGGDSWVSMLGYSLSLTTPATISEIKAVGGLAIFFAYSESVIILAVFVILILLLWENRRERYRKDLEKTVNQLDNASIQFEKFFNDNYRLSIRSAERWLMEYQRLIFGWLFRMNYGPRSYPHMEELLKREPLLSIPKPTKRKRTGRSKRSDSNLG